MRSKRPLPRLAATSVVTGMLLLPGPVLPARAAGGPDLAAGKPVTASSANGQYTAAHVNDGNQASYWESGNGALPQWVQVELGAATPVIGAGQTLSLPVTGTWTAAAGGATVTADATGTAKETNEDNNAYRKSLVVGRGAAAPFTSYEAEDGKYQGELLQADAIRTFGHTDHAAESSGRKSVKLTAPGQYVEITSTVPTNSIVVRNSIPDAPGGGGTDATLSLYVDNVFVQKLNLTSQYSWPYGTTDQPEGLTQTPQADARRLFDETHALLPTNYPAGTKLRLQRDSGDTAASYTIDLIDLEQVAPPKAKPVECTSITDFGAVPDDGKDDTAAIQAAVTADQNGSPGRR